MEYTQTRLRIAFVTLSIFTFCVVMVLNVVAQNSGSSFRTAPVVGEQKSAEALVRDWLQQVERNLSEIREQFSTQLKTKKIVPMKMRVRRRFLETAEHFHTGIKEAHPSIAIQHLRMNKTVLEAITPIVFPVVYSNCSDKRLKNSDCDTNLTRSHEGRLPVIKNIISSLLIIPGGFSDKAGDVFVNGSRIIPNRCRPDHRVPAKQGKFRDEVFSVAQFWSNGFFHAFVESLPRLMPYVDFLRAHPNISIQVHSPGQVTTGILNVLKLKNPLVSGAVQSRVLYLPSGGGCGSTNPGLNLLERHLLRTGLPNNRTNHILLIKRKSKRWFRHHDRIAEFLTEEGAKYGLKLVVFGSSPVPTFRQSRQMFNEAALIVGPHGAGLANTIFTPSGRHVIEGMCNQKRGEKFNLCFGRLTSSVGLKYFGLVPKKDCFDVQPGNLKEAVNFALEDFNRTSLSGTISRSLH